MQNAPGMTMQGRGGLPLALWGNGARLGVSPPRMKTSLLCALLGLLAAGASPVWAAPAAPRAEVIYDHPEKVTDVKDAFLPTDKGSAAILRDLSTFLVQQADHFVPAGSKLKLTFTDIDLAGDFEPWRGERFDDIRIVKDIYPPHFKFSYTLTDASGRVVRSGREDITDMFFQNRVTLDRLDPLRYEKQILQDWMRRQLHDAKPVAAAL